MNVKEIANLIIEKYWNRSIPVDVEDVAKKIGVDVQYLPQLIGGEDISGRFDIINNTPTCTIRNTDPIQRQRFTLAHEIGHFVLGHGGGFMDNAASFNFYNLDKRETDANHFAIELIIPELAVNYAFDKQNINSIEELAKLFNVSPSAMGYRLKQLGIC